MEKETLLKMPMFIEVQGDNALDLIGHSDQIAKYQVNGFDGPRLFLHDHREEIYRVLEQMLEANDVSQFAKEFCRPVEAVLERTENGDLLMELFGTKVEVPELMCWIVVGIEGEFPEYPSLIQEVQPMEADRSAGLCIYPLEQERMAAFMGLSADASDSPVPIE